MEDAHSEYFFFLSNFIKTKTVIFFIQGVPKGRLQTLRGGRGHEDKHYSVGNHGAQTSSAGTGGR